MASDASVLTNRKAETGLLQLRRGGNVCKSGRWVTLRQMLVSRRCCMGSEIVVPDQRSRYVFYMHIFFSFDPVLSPDY